MLENRFGTNKSQAARRQVPLGALLDAEEQRVISACRAMRARASAAATFIADPMTGQPIGLSWLSQTVSSALNAVLGGSGWTFHHLRHSAANNIFLALEGAEALCSQMTGWSPERQWEIRKAVQGNPHARQNRYTALATFIGHASPQQTFQSYIHLVEPLLAERRFGQPVRHERNVYGLVLDLAKPRASLLKVDGDAARIAARKLAELVDRPGSVRPEVQMPIESTSLVSRQSASPANVHRALTIIQEGGSPEEAAAEASVGLEQVEFWLANARALAARTTKAGNPRFFTRARIARTTRDRNVAELLLPALPNSRTEPADSTRLIEHWLAKLHAQEHSVCASVALAQVIKRFDPSNPGLPFVRVEELRQYMQVFDDLKYAKGRWMLDLRKVGAGQEPDWHRAADAFNIEIQGRGIDRCKSSAIAGYASLSLRPPRVLRFDGKCSGTLKYAAHLTAIMNGSDGL